MMLRTRLAPRIAGGALRSTMVGQVRWGSDYASRSDEEVVELMFQKKIKMRDLEKIMEPDYTRAVRIRRSFVKDYMRKVDEDKTKPHEFDGLPFEDYNYHRVYRTNCENVVGFVPIPVGMAGPVLVDGKEYPLPMATTEGALVASTHRGAQALSASGGVSTAVLSDGMTRAPVVQFPSLREVVEFKEWVDAHRKEIEKVVKSSSRFCRLTDLKVTCVNKSAYIRVKCFTGDAMGMNMVTKATNKVMDLLKEKFPTMSLVSVSGNYCTDKKPSGINWVEGRGKTVIASALIPKKVLEKTLKTTAKGLADLNQRKNLVGSALAGSIGGFNAHASNAVAAIFIATGQDPAQVVESSNCLTLMETAGENGEDLEMSVHMPSIEVGTIGGGTTLAAQKAMLSIIGVDGSKEGHPGENAQTLARVIAAGVMCSEVSLMASLEENSLWNAHANLGRNKAD